MILNREEQAITICNAIFEALEAGKSIEFSPTDAKDNYASFRVTVGRREEGEFVNGSPIGYFEAPELEPLKQLATAMTRVVALTERPSR